MKRLEGYMHGINLGGWLSQCDHTKERYDTFITEDDIKTISSWGLDHIRVPVDYNLVEEADGSYIESGFAYFQKVLDWCGTYGLHMVLDLHKTYGYSFDAGEGECGFFDSVQAQERFYRLWENFATRFGKYHDRLCFELLNEVTDKEYGEKWNEIATTCIARIRKIAPKISILLGGYYNNSIEALKDLPQPMDEGIIYNFHCYEPLIFTHQGAPWIDSMDTSFRMPFASTYETYDQASKQQLTQFTESMDAYDPKACMGVEFFEHLMEEAVAVAEERNVALYCGEYGVIDRATPEDALAWYQMICSCFDRYGIGRAAWSYKEMDFGISDTRMDGVRQQLCNIL
ncbi:MAG: glycoside hydrolase family 5 protein [Lachnospiraceae bacterium]|nr:glycoside hydrolase family 5 protein [Lachnospiraceae bacterium]